MHAAHQRTKAFKHQLSRLDCMKKKNLRLVLASLSK